MIGNWKSQAIMGPIAIALWAIAYVWYFVIGAGRVSEAFSRLFVRLGWKRQAAPPPKPRRKAKPQQARPPEG